MTIRRIPLVVCAAAVWLSSAAAPAAAADRYVRLPAHIFKASASASGEYSMRVRVHDDPGRTWSRGRGEADVRFRFKARFTPTTRYDRELRFFARPIRSKRLRRALLPDTLSRYESTVSGVQTATGWVDDYDRWTGTWHGRAQFSCKVTREPAEQRSLVGVERRARKGWRVFLQPFQSIVLDNGEEPLEDGCVVTSPTPGRAADEGWRAGILRRIAGLLATPDGLVGSPRTGPDEAPGGAWSKLADDVAARWTVSHRTLRRKRFRTSARGKLPRSYDDCRATYDDDLGEDVVEACTQSLTWNVKLRARKLCPNRRGFYEYLRRGRQIAPGVFFCRGRRGIGTID